MKMLFLRSEVSMNSKMKKTRRKIREAFLKLLDKYPLNSITVKEIAEEADINRSTFYSHYDSLGTLIQEIEMEVAQKIITLVNENIPNDHNFEPMIEAIYTTILENPSFNIWFFDEKTTGLCERKIFEHASKILVPIWRKERNLTQEEAETYLQFVYTGIFGMLKRWYDAGFDQNVAERKKQYKEIIAVVGNYRRKEK